MCFPIEILAFAALDWSISDGCEGPAFPILGKAGRLKRWRPNVPLASLENPYPLS